MKHSKTAVVILTAGISNRMRQPKALLLFNTEETFISRIISTYVEWGCEEVIVVANKTLSEQFRSLHLLPRIVKLVVNNHSEFERFFSVKLGLDQIIDSEYCFIQNIDNPFISGDILDELFNERSKTAYVSPVYNNKGGHPVLISRMIIDLIRNHPVFDANLKEVLSQTDCRRIEMKDDRVLININDISEFKKYM